MDRPARILAVDDERRAVELVQRVLRKMAEVETAMSGSEAWRLFEAGDFDLVISDQRMPGMTGVELLSQIAEASPETGRILLTGYADAADTLDAINRAHVHAYLSKPCPPTQLSLTVRSVLERVALQRRVAGGGGPGGDEERLRELIACSEQLRAGLALQSGESVSDERAEQLARTAERIAELAEGLAAKPE